MSSGRLWTLLTVAALLAAGCADKRISLKYAGDSSLTPLARPKTLTVYQFQDRRGDEGEADPLRVGGIYGAYGNRLSKVMVDSPFQRAVVDALVKGFKIRGVQVQGVNDRLYQPGMAVQTDLVLAGELRNFSTEARFSNSAHISGILRLYDSRAKLLLEKPISVRERTQYGGGGVFTSVDDLEKAMNDALANFVRAVVTDPDVSARVSGPSAYQAPEQPVTVGPPLTRYIKKVPPLI